MVIDIIIPTYDRIPELRCMLSSLIAQTNKNWKASVVIDDTYNKNIENMVSLFNDDRISYFYTGKRYNNFGHTPREMGKQLSNGEYIVMSGDDNYYTPNFINEVIMVADSNPGVIYWDMVHSHYGYSYFQCKPYFNQIDMGAFATRKDIAHNIKLNTTFAADGEYIEDIKKIYPNEKMIKINKVLFVHN